MKLKEPSFIHAASLAGLLHDLGKYRVEFQNYLNAGDRGRRSNETAHAIYGAAAAGAVWDALAASFAIAGHHAGLHDLDQLAGQLSSEKFQALDRFSDLLGQANDAPELAGDLETLLPDLDLWVVDAECYDLQRDIAFKERPPEDFIV